MAEEVRWRRSGDKKEEGRRRRRRMRGEGEGKQKKKKNVARW